jgi:hypothetical protein
MSCGLSFRPAFQTELRELLPEPYIISHAPVAPWFTSANDYASGAYVKIHQDVGDGIDFYNIQVSVASLSACVPDLLSNLFRPLARCLQC